MPINLSLGMTVLGIYCLLSGITFITYLLDKSAAQAGRWRVPEKTLHTLALAGGWPGALLAQKMFRHKTSKKEFQLVFILTVVLNVVGLVFFYSGFS
jgi:uncharacterized membrane protein YsdA (DUF1294 family)